MGMFDYIYVHEKYLADDEPTTGWQTKDLECTLNIFQLDEEGNLIRKTELTGESWSNRDCHKPEEYTGDLNFCTSLGDYNLRTNDWREYKATFDRGKLINIDPVYE